MCRNCTLAAGGGLRVFVSQNGCGVGFGRAVGCGHEKAERKHRVRFQFDSPDYYQLTGTIPAGACTSYLTDVVSSGARGLSQPGLFLPRLWQRDPDFNAA